MMSRIRDQSESLPETESLALLPALFVSAKTSYVYESTGGEVKTARLGRKLDWLWRKHLGGHARFGLSPVRANGTCKWGALDLDAHGAGDADRQYDAVAVAAKLRKLGLTPYLSKSRGGRGWHVYVFFADAGVRADDLNLLLSAFAEKYAPADVFPTGRKPIFLPGFNGSPLLDADLCIADPKHIEPDDPALVRAAFGNSYRPYEWPPRYMKPSRPSSGRVRARELEDVAHLLFDGPSGLTQARAGARNKIAGMTARKIFSDGGSFADFCAWDAYNLPPMASDSFKELEGWWKWAVKKPPKRASR